MVREIQQIGSLSAPAAHFCIFVGDEVDEDVVVLLDLESVDHVEEEERLGGEHGREELSRRLSDQIEVDLQRRKERERWKK